MSVGAGRDPNRAPCRRYRQPVDAIEHDRVLDGRPVLVDIDEALSGLRAVQPRLKVVHELERNGAWLTIRRSGHDAAPVRRCLGTARSIATVRKLALSIDARRA